MSLISGLGDWLKKKLEDVSNATGGVVNNAENAVGSAVHNIVPQAAQQVQHFAQSPTGQFINSFGDAAGSAGFNTLKGLSNLGSHLFGPGAVQQNAQIWNGAQNFGSRNYQAPATPAAKIGQIAGSGFAQIPMLAGAGKAAGLAEDALGASKLVSSASPLIQGATKLVGGNLGGAAGYNLAAGTLTPKNLAVGTALGTAGNGALKIASPVARAVVGDIQLGAPSLMNPIGAIGKNVKVVDPAGVLGRTPTPAEQAVVDTINAGGNKADAIDAYKQSFMDRGMMFGGHAKADKNAGQLFDRFSGGSQPPVSEGVTSAPNGSGGVKMRGFTESVKTSSEVSPQTQEAVNATYTPKSNKILVQGQENTLNQGLNKATQQIQSSLEKPAGKINDQEVANAIAVAKAHDAAGNFNQASDIYDKLAEHLTESGRNVQAASLLNNRSPQGLLYSAQKVLKRAGVDLTDNLKSTLQGALDEVKATASGTPERDFAVAKFTKLVNDQIPSSFTDKAIGLWKAGLLTGIKTQTGNALSNVANSALKKASDPLAAAIDRGLSAFTGQRTKTATIKGLGSGLKEGTGAALNYLKTGIDERNLSNLKYDTKQLNFGNGVFGKAAQTYTDGIFRLMGAADRPYYYANLRNTLADLGKAEGLNKGLKGQALSDFVDTFMKEPPKQAFETATQAAEKSVFGNDTALSHLASGLRQGASKNPVANAIVNVIAPFTRVPSSVITQVFDYTPVGAVSEIIKQGARRQLDQRALSEALAKAGVGTVGAIFTGMGLTKAGVLTGAYPTDPKEQARWKAEGKQPNSIYMGGKWRSLNYVSPFGPLLGMGQNIEQALQDGKSNFDAVMTATGGGIKTALGQSFLQGVQGALDAVNDPQRSLKKFVNSEAGSLIPTLSGDIAKATDAMQRQTNSPLDAITAKIPGLRESLLPSQDAFGNDLKNTQSPVETMIDPTRPSTAVSTPLTNELDRLGTNGQNIFPTIDKSISVGGKTIKLNDQQVYDWNKNTGQQTSGLWSSIVSNPAYGNLPDDKKKAALQAAASDIKAVEKVKMLQAMGASQADIQTALDSLTKTQQGILQGNAYDPNSYITKQEPKAKKTKIAKGKGVRVRSSRGKGHRIALRGPGIPHTKALARQVRLASATAPRPKSLKGGIRVTTPRLRVQTKSTKIA